MLEAIVAIENEIAVITLTGTVDLDGARLLKDKISSARQDGHMKVVLDLVNVDKVQSAHLQQLVSPIRALTAIGGKVALVGMSKSVQQMMKSTMFYTLVDVFDDVDDAVANLC